jgi:hypothetical protein
MVWWNKGTNSDNDLLYIWGLQILCNASRLAGLEIWDWLWMDGIREQGVSFGKLLEGIMWRIYIRSDGNKNNVDFQPRLAGFACFIMVLFVWVLGPLLTLGETFGDFSGQESFAFTLMPRILDSQTGPALIFSLDNQNQDELKTFDHLSDEVEKPTSFASIHPMISNAIVAQRSHYAASFQANSVNLQLHEMKLSRHVTHRSSELWTTSKVSRLGRGRMDENG